MLFHKRLGILLLGLTLCGLASAAFADFPWNPFAKKTETKPQSSTTNPFSAFSSRSAGTKPAGQPITESTRRKIVEESRHYPASQRSQLIAQFSRLDDAQARQRLNQMQIARIDRQRTQQSGLASTRRVNSSQSIPSNQRFTANNARSGAYNDFLANPPSNFDLNQAAQSSTTRQPAVRPATARRSATSGYSLPDLNRSVANGPSTGAATSFGLSNTSPRIAGDAGFARTRSSQTASYRNPFPQAGDEASQRRQLSNFADSDQSVGYARTGNVGEASVQRAVRPERNELPTIRPAGAAGSDSIAASEREYADHYQPVAATVGQNADPRQFNRAAVQQTTATTRTLPSQTGDLGALIARAEDDVRNSIPGRTDADRQRHVTRHVELRLLYLVSGQRDRALTAIPAISEDEQAFWTRVFWGLATYLDADHYPDRGERTTLALDQMRSAIQSLQGQADLSIRKAAFCTDIVSFGDYTKFDSDAFAPGQQVLIYSELENFHSERTDEGQFQTVLKSTVELFPAGGDRAVDTVPYNETTDRCNSTRRDFIQGYRYHLPQQLAAGAYVLRLTIEDQLGGKSATYRLNLTVR